MITVINKKFPNQPEEEYYGNREYKLMLNNGNYTNYTINKKNQYRKSQNKKNQYLTPQINKPQFNNNITQTNTNYNTNLMESNKNVDIKSKLKELKQKKIEYKKLQKRSTQMLFRINEGKGKAIYIIGIDDNGKNIGISMNNIYESILYLELMSLEINATINTYRIYQGSKGFILTARVSITPFKEIEFF